MYNSHNIAILIKQQAKAKNIVIKTMLSDLGLGSNTMSAMYHGKALASDSLAKIADYLGCSVDYLLGRTDVPDVNCSLTAHNDESQGLSSLFMFNLVKQRENAQKKPAPEAGNELSEKDMQLLAKIMALPDDKFDDAMDYLDYLISKGEKK